MRDAKRQVEEKNKLLRTVGSQPLDVLSLQSRWEDLELRLQAHQTVMEGQKERLKEMVNKRIADYSVEVQKFSSRWNELKPKNVKLGDLASATKTLTEVKDWRADFTELHQAGNKIIGDCEHFGMAAPMFEGMAELEADIDKTCSAWDKIESFISELEELAKQDWISFRDRLYTFEDFLQTWTDNMKAAKVDSITRALGAEVDRLKNVVPYLKFVKGDAFTPDHWGQLFRLLRFPKTITKVVQLEFRTFLDAADEILDKATELKHLAARASGELTVRQAMEELAIWGQEASFAVMEHSDVKGKLVPIIKEWRDIMTQVGDHQSMVAGMKDSPFFSTFEDEAGRWETKLSALGSILHDLQAVQRKWLYLEPIFGRDALPQETGRFNRVDEDFRRVMQEVQSDNRVMSLVGIASLQEQLPGLIDQLDRCQKALTDYLEEKRAIFPRFYFIGDDDLLEILGQAQNPTVILSHLKKLFQGVHSVDFTPDNTGLTAMKSLEGEVVTLNNTVAITEHVEEWLRELAKEMQSTLSASLKECLKVDDPAAFPSQILCAADQIHFTRKMEKAIGTGRTADVEQELRDKLAALTSHDCGDDTLLSIKLKALVLDLIHDLDVVEQVRREGARSTDDWFWRKQLRFYDGGETGCLVHMCDAEFLYTFEYQGNAPKLVHTPLTDKCYLTLTQGMHLGYGGNPYGPAGTGKTESVKALGQAMARMVLVFNCDEGIDYKSMGRIFMGLVKCGAWGCFDEFNRLEEEVLSAVSQQIQIIQAALKARAAKVELMGQEVQINRNSGIFVTLNPAGKGYGGRSKLPDNLKQLFRSVAMAAPDNALIAEVILSAEGFLHAKELGEKVVALFGLSKQLLSKQQHYDWGLRALKTILTIAGQLFAASKRAGGGTGKDIEEELVIKAIRVNTLAKLTFADTLRFKGLITDLFPGARVLDVNYDDLEEAIQKTLVEFHLDPIPAQIRKIVQLYEALNQRMGVVIVGPSGCGKSTLLRVLKKSLEREDRGVKRVMIVQHQMNPKAIPRQQLLGHMNLDTREWFDGVLTASARQVVKEPAGVHSWITCDGDIDPEWVESLNSVLDDNRLLTMPSGERIRFSPNVNFVFETHDLRFASPATVSRMGMIFLSDEDMDVSCLVKSWIRRQPAASQVKLQSWTDQLFEPAMKLTLGYHAFVVDTTRVGIVNGALSHLVGVETKEEFVVALINGFGSNLDLDARAKLAEEVFQLAGERPVDPRKPLETYYNKDAKALKGYTADLSVSLQPADLVISSPAERDLPVVMTVDLQKNTALFSKWLDAGEPFLLVGPEGAGKSLLLRHAFSKMRSADVATINCSAQTTAAHVIQKLAQSCSLFTSSTGRVYRPKSSERLILYLKDLNLPKPDKYHTIQLIAFLQQLISYGGFYEGLEWVGIERIQLVCSMNPATTVGRHALSTRFTSITRIASISYPPKEQLQQVFTAYLAGAVSSRLPKHPTWGDSANIQKLSSTFLDIFEKIKHVFTVDDHRHYLFTPRDIAQWVVGLLRYDIGTVNLLSAVTYEAQRVFRDRLVGPDAVSRFDSTVNSILRLQWKFNPEGNYVYSTFAPTAAETLPGMARPLGELPMADWGTCVAQALTKYTRECKDLDILLFPEILERIARMERVLSQPGGSLLLVGRSGVGRRTCATLACHMHRMEVTSPKIGRNYTMKHFFADLKGAVVLAGVQGQPTALMLEDFQLCDPTFLESINSLLSSGEVPGMFSPNELDPLLAPLKEEFSSQGYKYRSPYAFFLNRVQRNLHVILSIDPTHPEFLVRGESNPALYTRTNILWLDRWSREGMQEVPNMLLAELLPTMQPHDPATLVGHLQRLHDSCVPTGATPRHYITFLNTYASMAKAQQQELSQQIGFLEGGLHKLTEAKEHVDILSREAEKQRAELTEKQAAADSALGQITQNMDVASVQKREAEVLAKELAIESEKIAKQKIEIESQLAEVQPVLEQAKKAVGSIKKDNINEIRSLKMPPEAIRDVLEAVLRLMGNYDASWNSMRRFLSQPSVIQEIIQFDAHKITNDIRESVRQILVQKQQSFVKENIFRVSQAAGPLAEWVKAQVKYSIVLEKVSPLETELAAASGKMESARSRLQECQDKVEALDAEVGELKARFSNLTAEAQMCKSKLEEAMVTLTSANSLLGKLHDERARWDVQLEELSVSMSSLPLNAMCAAAFVSYLGGMAENVRASMTRSWVEALGLPSFSLLEYASTESQRLTWKTQGLPADGLSMENAVTILNCKQFPLVLDPSSQAAVWLKNHLGAEGPVEVMTQQDERFNNTLEVAVRFGKVLIMGEVDVIEPVLVPLLRRDLSVQGPRKVVNIGDKVVDFNDSFRLFLVSRNSQMRVDPDCAALVTMVNFSVTRSGLEGQLLGLTIQHEKPELEEQKSILLKNEEDLKLKLAELERNLLQQLAKSEGNILKNHVLINGLNETKASSIESAKALADSLDLQKALDQQRDVYRPMSLSAAGMFFLIQDLRAVNYMYQFDLPTFLSLFKLTLQSAPQSSDVANRLTGLLSALKKTVFSYVGRSLFKESRLTFAIHLVHGLHPDLFKEKEWEFLVGQVIGGSEGSVPPWVPKDRGPAFQRLVSVFPTLSTALNFSDGDAWTRWMKGGTCEADFPPKAMSSTRAFQRVLVVQALRPDRLQTALENFVCEVLGLRSVNPPPLNLSRLSAEETVASTPILFITTPGADPSPELEELAECVVTAAHYHQLAMGQGQSETALALLRQCAANGEWLTLKNVHLVIAWLPTLEKELHSLKPAPTFRLWLTTEVHAKFPPILLQQSLKVTFEAPPGVKKNLQRTYDSWSPQLVGKGGTARAHLMFVLAWFHAVVQERRTYIPQGWSKFYEFSFADLRSGVDIIDAMPEEAPIWPMIHGLLESAIYGGRVDNPLDTRVLRAYLQSYFHPDNISAQGRPNKDIPLTRGMKLPPTNKHSDYVSLINSIPDVDNPAFFGLPPNIDRLVQVTNSANVLANLQAMSAAEAASGAFDREKWSAQLQPLLTLWATLSQAKGLLREVPVDSGSENLEPLTTFVQFECALAHSLARRVHASMESINKVLKGSELLSSSVQQEAQALISGEPPDGWVEDWEGPPAPARWLQLLQHKTVAIDGWREAVASGALLSNPVNLNALLRPATFLMALRQQTARKAGVSMDKLKLVCGWDSSANFKAAALPCGLTGLLLQGATFSGQLADGQADTPTVVSLPQCRIAFVPSDAPDAYPESSCVKIPVYEALDRTALLMELGLPCRPGEQSKWILAGVGILLSAD